MPRVKKTTAKKTTEKTGGIRDKIRKVGDSGYGLRVNLYGRGKTGKTTLAATFPKPLILIGTMGSLEDGTLSIANVEGVDFFPLETMDEWDPILAEVKNYKTVVLDTGGGLQDMILKEHLGLDDVPVQKSWGMARQQDWQVVGSQTKERLRDILSLSMTDGLHTIIIAHERSFDSNDSHEGITPTVGSALSPAVAGWLNGACDYVAQCFIREETKIITQKGAKKEVKIEKKTGKSEYCLRIGPHPIYLTGFRKPREKEIPDVLVDPSYEKIVELIKGS